MKRIRGSEVQDFLRCRTRWDFRWRESLIPRRKNDKLFFGTLFHIFLEELYKTKDCQQAVQIANDEFYKDFNESDEMYDLQDMMTIIMFNYYERYQDDFETYTVVATELQFEIPLIQGSLFTGTIDLILRDKDNNLWFVDHKTTNSIEKYEKNAIMDRQINRYWWAIQQLALGNGKILNEEYQDIELESPHGFIYNIILKDYPTRPDVLKSGALSKNKAQKTTVELYKQAIKENGLKESDYLDIIEILSTQTDRYFKRVEVFRNQHEIDATMNEVKAIADDMVSPLVYRNITGDCHWDCQYKDLCLAEIDGSDSSWLKGELYDKGEKNDGIDD